jgi:hypothetical protein
VPGAASSPLGIGLSRDRIDSEDGALDAPTPPLPSLFIGIPPTAPGVGCWLAIPPPCADAGTFDVLSLFICALTCWKCRSYSHAACCRRKGCVTPNSCALCLI